MKQVVETSIGAVDVESEEIYFADVPLPPSVNEMYSTFVRRGTINRVPSGKLRQWKRVMGVWENSNRGSLSLARSMIFKWRQLGFFIRLEIDVFFLQERIFTAKGELKKNDVSNRIKAVEDSLCDSLGIDDKCIFEIIARKKVGAVPHCKLRFSPMKLS